MDPKQVIDKVVDNIKEMLKIGPRHYVGIDIGLSAVKVAEVKITKKGAKR